MKRIQILFILTLLSGIAYSQHETLFSRARVLGGFAAPIVEFGNIKGEYVTSMGGGGGLIIDEFFIGAYGMGSLEHLNHYIDNSDNFRMELAHGGFWLGYTPSTFRLLHPYTSAKIGWGFADLRGDPFNIDSDGIFVFIPEVGLELNVAKFFRISASVGYRMVNDVDRLAGLSNKDFSSVTGQLTFRFGWFGRGYKSTGDDLD